MKGGGGYARDTAPHCSAIPLHLSLWGSHPSHKHYRPGCLLCASCISCSVSAACLTLSHSVPCLAYSVVTEHFSAFIHSTPLGRKRRLITGGILVGLQPWPRCVFSGQEREFTESFSQGRFDVMHKPDRTKPKTNLT